MINGESWLARELQCDLSVIKIINYHIAWFMNHQFHPLQIYQIIGQSGYILVYVCLKELQLALEEGPISNFKYMAVLNLIQRFTNTNLSHYQIEVQNIQNIKINCVMVKI